MTPTLTMRLPRRWVSFWITAARTAWQPMGGSEVAVVTVGKLSAGTVINVIPDSAEILINNFDVAPAEAAQSIPHGVLQLLTL